MLLRVQDRGAQPALRDSLFFSISVVLRGRFAWELVTAVKADAPRQDLWTGQASGTGFKIPKHGSMFTRPVIKCGIQIRRHIGHFRAAVSAIVSGAALVATSVIP